MSSVMCLAAIARPRCRERGKLKCVTRAGSTLWDEYYNKGAWETYS